MNSFQVLEVMEQLKEVSISPQISSAQRIFHGIHYNLYDFFLKRHTDSKACSRMENKF